MCILWQLLFQLDFQKMRTVPAKKIKIKINVSNERYGSLIAKRYLPYEPFHWSEEIDQTSSDPLDRLTISKPMSRIDQSSDKSSDYRYLSRTYDTKTEHKLIGWIPSICLTTLPRPQSVAEKLRYGYTTLWSNKCSPLLSLCNLFQIPFLVRAPRKVWVTVKQKCTRDDKKLVMTPFLDFPLILLFNGTTAPN